MSDLELLDCGEGRRLERFGRVIVDRPAPAATMPKRLGPDEWDRPALRWARSAWVRGAAADPWPVRGADLVLECRPAAGGQVGVFPEHAATWAWLDGATRTAATSLGRPPEILSLFAYTGGASLACARAGASVAHVDASKPAVAWARRNAELSGVADRPIRWIVDDAVAFTQREARRGRRYAGIVLDPPSYGHGPGTRPWRLEDDLPGLLAACGGVIEPDGFVLLTAHTPGFDAERLGQLLDGALGRSGGTFDGGELAVSTGDGHRLELGAFIRRAGGA